MRRPKTWLDWLGAALVCLAAVSIVTLSGARAIIGRVCTGAQLPVLQKATDLPFFRGLPAVLNIAHRGASKLAAEHSMAAYELALAQGADVLELDLRSTRDLMLLVTHDATLERTLGRKEKIAALSFAELTAATHGRLPLTLDEVLSRFPSARFNLELKDESLAAARVLAELLAVRRAEERVLVASVHREVLSELRRVTSGRVSTSASAQEVLRYYFCYLMGKSCHTPYAALQLPALGWLGLTHPDFLKHVHARGLVVHFWTIDDEVTMRDLIDAGADGIMTDWPDVLARTLSERRE